MHFTNKPPIIINCTHKRFQFFNISWTCQFTNFLFLFRVGLNSTFGYNMA
ncbi:unnamed protein product [Meloidogyne enterolobii]|uniref:Uncharacterized protein n=2 Tax=Meloidogyne enterolobii TaxID=390850 RepID=A0ACB1AS27_MELEN